MSLTDTGSARLAFMRNVGVVPATPAFLELPFTSESLSEKLTSAQSASMRDDRQFASSRLVRGESAGDVALEMAYGLWFDDIIQGVLQSSTQFPASPVTTDSDDLTNGKTKTYFLFEKTLEAESGFEYPQFEDCQIGSMSIDVQSNALVSMSVGVVGLESKNSQAEVTGATYAAYDLDDQMDTNSAVLEFKDSGNTTIPVTAQNLTLAIDNQMRGQQGVGYFYNAGNASGRIKVTLNGSIYFRNQTLYNKFKGNEGVKVFLTLSDSAGNYYKFSMENVKVTGHDISAGGADQDLVASIEMQAFPATAAGDKTITVTRYTA